MSGNEGGNGERRGLEASAKISIGRSLAAALFRVVSLGSIGLLGLGSVGVVDLGGENVRVEPQSESCISYNNRQQEWLLTYAVECQEFISRVAPLLEKLPAEESMALPGDLPAAAYDVHPLGR